MPETNLTDVIKKIFEENHRTFMTLKQVVFNMSAAIKRDFGVAGLTNAAEMQKILSPFLDTKKYVFHRRGTFIFILEAKPREDFVFDTVIKRPRTPKDIARLVPFSKKETAGLLVALIKKRILRLNLDEDLQTRIYYNPEGAKTQQPEKTREKTQNKPQPSANVEVNQEETQPKRAPIKANPEYAEYTVENFKNAFRSLDKGRIFVRICDIRRLLGWPRAIFDSALKQLRDAKLIQLHAGDVTLMTPDEVQDCFVDENGFRMGTITWHGR